MIDFARPEIHNVNKNGHFEIICDKFMNSLQDNSSLPLSFFCVSDKYSLSCLLY